MAEQSPYLQRIRAEGRAEGSLTTRQQDLVAFLVARFALTTARRRRLTQRLRRVTDEPTLTRLLTTAARCESLEAFLAACDEGSA